MRLYRTLVHAGVLAVACMALAGCVSLLPKAKPADMYRFGAAPAVQTDASAPVQPGSINIAQGPVNFDTPASNDRILTMTGPNAAYVANARWISPAPALFGEALLRAFETTPGAPRLLAHAAPQLAPTSLSVDVQAFEARYDQGADAPPSIVVVLHATLYSQKDRSIVAERTFSVAQRAGDNRVSAIVGAFNTAVQQILAGLITWSGQAAA